MMKAKALLGKFWGEAVSTAVFILNRSLTRSLDGKTPFEAWHGERPAVSFFRTFGCIAHVKNTKPYLKELDDRSTPMIFVGYEAGSKAYRVYNPVDGRVSVTRDAMILEDAQWNWDMELGGGRDGGSEEFVVEYLAGTKQDVGGEPARRSPAAVNSSPAAAPPGTPWTPGNAPTVLVTPHLVTPSVTPEPVEFVTPPFDHEDMLDADHDEDVPARFRKLDDVWGPATPLGPVLREFADERLMFASAEEPATFKEAEKEECWRCTMEAEIQSIKENKTWSLVDLPPGHKPISLKWVFKVKRDEHDAIVKHKGRLMAKGYVQRPGIDFTEVFAPVARLESVRVLLALAAHEG
jgi:hypothetical protein